MASFIAVALFHNYGINFFTLFGQEEINTFGMPLMGRIYGSWNISSFVFMFFFVSVVTSFISLFPAIWAARKDVIKAIHHKK